MFQQLSAEGEHDKASMQHQYKLPEPRNKTAGSGSEGESGMLCTLRSDLRPDGSVINLGAERYFNFKRPLSLSLSCWGPAEQGGPADLAGFERQRSCFIPT